MQLIIKKLTVIVGNEIYDAEGELIPDLVSIPFYDSEDEDGNAEDEDGNESEKGIDVPQDLGAGDGAGLFENVPKDARGGDDDASDVVPGNREGDRGG